MRFILIFGTFIFLSVNHCSQSTDCKKGTRSTGFGENTLRNYCYWGLDSSKQNPTEYEMGTTLLFCLRYLEKKELCDELRGPHF